MIILVRKEEEEQLRGLFGGDRKNGFSLSLWVPLGMPPSVCGSQSSRFHKWAILKKQSVGNSKMSRTS